MSEILLYHGSKEEVVYPEIRITTVYKGLFLGILLHEQLINKAYRWADRRSADWYCERLSLCRES